MDSPSPHHAKDRIGLDLSHLSPQEALTAATRLHDYCGMIRLGVDAAAASQIRTNSGMKILLNLPFIDDRRAIVHLVQEANLAKASALVVTGGVGQAILETIEEVQGSNRLLISVPPFDMTPEECMRVHGRRHDAMACVFGQLMPSAGGLLCCLDDVGMLHHIKMPAFVALRRRPYITEEGVGDNAKKVRTWHAPLNGEELIQTAKDAILPPDPQRKKARAILLTDIPADPETTLSAIAETIESALDEIAKKAQEAKAGQAA